MKLLEVKNPKAPLVRKTIAHRFIGGSRWQTETSPVRDGREWFSNLLSSLTGLISFGNISPGVETPGYGLSAFGLEQIKVPSAGAFLPAPLARPTIAHRFNGGCRCQIESSPVRDGRKWISDYLSSLRDSLHFEHMLPALKRWAMVYRPAGF
jgi:hypothetical protein